VSQAGNGDADLGGLKGGRTRADRLLRGQDQREAAGHGCREHPRIRHADILTQAELTDTH
jgi:hypothetical protein